MTYHILARVIILLLFVWIYVTGVNSERCQNTFHRNANGTLDLVFNCTTRDKYDFCKIMEFTRYHTEHTCIFSESRGHLNKVHCYPSDFSSKIDYSPDQSENQCVLKIKGINPLDDSIVDDYTTNLQWLIYLFVGTVIVALGAIMILVAIKEKKYKCRSYAAAEAKGECVYESEDLCNEEALKESNATCNDEEIKESCPKFCGLCTSDTVITRGTLIKQRK